MAAKLRIAFMGTPDFAVPPLEALHRAGHDVAAVYTQPPRPSGRGHKTLPSPVQRRAEALGVPVRHPVSLKTEEEKASFAALGLDLAVVAAYGLILPRAILESPRLGCINIHASLLPRWRGAAPIQRAILAGDKETGITIMRMDTGLDTGAMLLRKAVPIAEDTTAASLHDTLAVLGAELILPAVEGLAAGPLTPMPQPAEGVTYAAKLDRAEGQLDWRQPAAMLATKVRALNPAPGVWFDFGGERIKVLAAHAAKEISKGTPGEVLDDDLAIATENGVFQPDLLQRPGKQPVDRDAFLRGLRIVAGTLLPCPATN